MPTPVRTIRIADDLWTDVEATAEAEGVDVSTVVRNALSAYVKAAGVALVAVLAIVILGACGGAEPAAQPVSEPSVAAAVEPSTTSSASPDVDLSQPGARREVVRRVEAGECLSISFGPTALEWSDWMSKRPEMSDGSKWQADFASWISGQPVGCDDTDRQALAAFG